MWVNMVYVLKMHFNNITVIFKLITWKLTKRDRKHMNIFERNVYRRILGPLYIMKKKIGGY
jgi:hypothetical protein